MKARFVNENFEDKNQFFMWWNKIQREYPDQYWDWILGTLINDENSSDEELLDYLQEGDVDFELAQELVEHRNGFLNYGLEI